MPNYVTNIVSIDGSLERMAEMLDHIAFDGHPGTFDFNKVIPMPKSLDLTSGGITNDAINAYLSVVRPDSESKLAIGEKLDPSELRFVLDESPNFRPFFRANFHMSDQEIADMANSYKSGHPEIQSAEDFVLLGKQYVDNYREHGALTWYDWAIEHWGTKWNNSSEEIAFNPDREQLCFETAWSTPVPVFMELSKQYPELTLEVNWADEDIGYNVGVRTYRGGECIDEYIPEPGSEEALEMSYGIQGEPIYFTPQELSEVIGVAKERVQEKQPPEKNQANMPKHSAPER